VAVLELGGAALDQLGRHGGGLTAGLAGTVLVLLAALSPWAVLRLVPLSELASSAAGSLRGEARSQLPQRTGGGGLMPAGRATETPEPVGPAAPDPGARAAEATLRRLDEQPDAPIVGHAEGSTDDGLAGGVGPGARAGVAEAAAEAPVDDPPEVDGAEPGTPAPRGPERWPAMFQAPNYSWKPLVLGSDGDVMNARLWSPDDPPAEEDVDGLPDEPDPLPPGQEDGPL
jgi:hypothetical protein